MKLSLATLAFLFFASLAFPIHAEDPPAEAKPAEEKPADSKMTRDESLINAFQVLCTLEPLHFDKLAEKAAAMQMPVIGEDSTPAGQEPAIRNKSWAGGVKDFPFVFMIGDIAGEGGIATSCAVGGEAPDADAFRETARKVMKLPGASRPELDGEGGRAFTWNNAYGPGTILVLRDFKPGGKPGVMLKLLAKEDGNEK